MKTRKVLSRLFIVLAIFLVLVIAALLAVPYFFKDELIAETEKVLDKHLRAKTTFEDVQVSLFRSFPDFSLKIEDIAMTGIGRFDGVPLLSASALEVDLDLWSVIKKNRPYEIHHIRLEKPFGNVLILKDGEPNYDVTGGFSKEADPDATPTEFDLQLSSYEIIDGRFDYTDLENGMIFGLSGLHHSGKGNFTQDVYDLTSTTDLEQIYLETGGITYLNNPKIHWDAILQMDMVNYRFTLKENDLRINDLQLLMDGYVAADHQSWSAINMDLTFDAPDNDFKQLLSIIPGAYTDGFDEVSASGNFSLSGFVKGTYDSETEMTPSFQANISVANGQFQYPELPVGISQIRLEGSVDNQSSNLDDMVVDFPTISMKIGQHPLSGSFRMKHPLSDPDIQARVKGDIELADLRNAIPLEGVTELSGNVNADLTLATRKSVVMQGKYDQLQMSGAVETRNFIYAQEGLPRVSISHAAAELNPKTIHLRQFDAIIGNSDLGGSAQIHDALQYFSPDGTITGSFDLTSDFFDVNEWLPEETTSPSTYGAGVADDNAEPFHRFDFDFTAAIKKLAYDAYTLTGVRAKGSLKPEQIKIESCELKMGESDFSAQGELTDWWDYAFHEGVLGGKLQIQSNYIDALALSEVSGEGEAPELAEEREPLDPAEIPERMVIEISADVDRLTYGKMAFQHMKGDLTIADRSALLKGMTANGFGGDLKLSGGYYTPSTEKPRFDLNYELTNLDFQQSFEALNTFEKLAPLAGYATGRYNASMNMSGELGKDYIPEFSNLNASGLLHTLDAVVKNFKPLQRVSDKLGLKGFNADNIRLRNTKNWFEVKDGAIVFSPADFAVKDIDLSVGGTHSLTGVDMDYQIKARVPRELIDQNALGAAATSGLDWVNSQATKLGVNLGEASHFNFQIDLAGSLTSPKVTVKLLGADGKKSIEQAAKDKVETEINEAVDDAKQRLEDEKKKAEAEAKRKLQDARKKAEEEARKRKEALEKKLEEEAKEKLKKLNPFKRD